MDPLSGGLLVAAAVGDVALAAWLLLRGRGDIDAARVGAAALGCAGFLALQWAAVLALQGPRLFFCLHLAWLVALYAVPASGGLVLLARRRRRVTPAAAGLAALGLLALPVGLWATLVEPRRLVLERADVPLGPEHAPAAPLRIGVLADVQCARVTAHERRAVGRLMAELPDLILMPGDLMQLGTRDPLEALPEFRALLAPLGAPLGVWFVLGNTDTAEGIARVTEGTRVRLLHNEVVRLDHGGREVLLCGVDLSFRSARAREALRRIEEGPASALRLLVAHRPDVVLALPQDSRVDLAVAGHTHGGQVVVPGFGPPITLSDVPRAVAAGGLHAVEGRRSTSAGASAASADRRRGSGCSARRRSPS